MNQLVLDRDGDIWVWTTWSQPDGSETGAWVWISCLAERMEYATIEELDADWGPLRPFGRDH